MTQTCHQSPTLQSVLLLSALHGPGASPARLSSLLYLADRLAITHHWHTITDDRYSNMDGVPFGIGSRRVISVLHGRGRMDEACEFDQLSLADEEILREIHARFAAMDDDDLVSHMKGLPEAGNGPISYAALASILAPDKSVQLEDTLETSRALLWLFQDSVCRVRP